MQILELLVLSALLSAITPMSRFKCQKLSHDKSLIIEKSITTTSMIGCALECSNKASCLAFTFVKVVTACSVLKCVNPNVLQSPGASKQVYLTDPLIPDTLLAQSKC